jgi:ABC-type dipeptide/oligopeptide/nickel transport system permease subunit
VLTAVTIAIVAGAPLLAQHGPLTMTRGSELQAPSRAHPLGTDQYGRDTWSRLVFGGRTSLAVGVIAVLLGGLFGVGSGVVAGYRGGAVDLVIMRLCDAAFAFPGILLAIAITAVLGPGVTTVALAVGVVTIPAFARLARSTSVAERQREYVMAAQSLGATESRVMLRHVLPSLAPVVLVQLQVAMAQAVLLEAGLSFVGLGARPPWPSWGSMLSESRNYLEDAPWMAIFPGLALLVLVLGLFLLGDALQDSLSGRAATPQV